MKTRPQSSSQEEFIYRLKSAPSCTAVVCNMHASVCIAVCNACLSSTSGKIYTKTLKRLTDGTPPHWQSVWIFFMEKLLDLERCICFHCVKDISQHLEEFVLALCWLQSRRANCSVGPIQNHISKTISTCGSPVTKFVYTIMHTIHQAPALLRNFISKCPCSHNPFNIAMTEFDMSCMNVCLSCWKCSW